MTRTKMLVTGATGFLGRHLLESLAHELPDARVCVLVRDRATWQSMSWKDALAPVEVIEGSITEPQGWQHDERLSNLDGVFHLAALVRHSRQDSKEVYSTNIDGAKAMVRVAAEHGARMVFVSTSGTVGCFSDADASADEDSPYCRDKVRTWPYYDSKISAEVETRALAEELATQLVFIRPPVLLGPGDHRFRSTGHIIRFLRRRLPFLIQGGIHYVDVRDASRAIIRAMLHPEPKPAYHLPGTTCGIAAFFATVHELSGVEPPRLFLPYWPAWLLATALRTTGVLPDPVVIEMAASYWGLRSKYAGDDLDFDPRPGRQTLEDTIAWLRDHHPDLNDAA
jgi:nucleoside-diphosphate-sugar epimerase